MSRQRRASTSAMSMPGMYYPPPPPPPPPMRAQTAVTPIPPTQPWTINECRIEGERCFVVAYQLDGLGQAIPPQHQAHLIATAEESRSLGNKLNALADASYRHYQRVDLMINYLNVVLPSIKKTLDDIRTHYEDRTKSRDMRWRTMYHALTTEAGNFPLPQRFLLYNAYLDGLLQLLLRDLHFDDNRFQQDRDRILTLRGQQKLTPPTDTIPYRPNPQLQLTGSREEDIHWAEEIFSRPLPCRTNLKRQPSETYAPFGPPGQMPSMPPACKVLFEREFENGAITVAVYMDRIGNTPFFLLTRRDRSGPRYTMIGAHELGIKRVHNTLELRRWSRSKGQPVLWAILAFRTWEDLVLFYCSFVSLKVTSPMSRRYNPDEFAITGEKRLFQAKITDDGYNHSLIVYKDKYTKGWRLHAAVWDGELRQVPIWTAFITKISQSADFLKKKSPRRVWLYGIDVYVFSQEYSQDRQRVGPSGAFEIKFDSEPGARHFVELFQPSSTEPSEATASTADSDDHAADDDDHNRAQVTEVSASTSTSTSNVTSATTSEDGSHVGYSREASDSGEEDEDDEDDEDEDEDGDDEIVESVDVSDNDSDSHVEAYSEAQSDVALSEGARSEDRHSDRPPRRDYSERLGDYVDYIRPDEISVEEVSDGADDSDRSSLGALSDGATLKVDRRESLLEAPEELHRLEGPEELNRLEAPKELAKLTDGRPPRPSVEDCSDDGS